VSKAELDERRARVSELEQQVGRRWVGPFGVHERHTAASCDGASRAAMPAPSS